MIKASRGDRVAARAGVVVLSGAAPAIAALFRDCLISDAFVAVASCFRWGRREGRTARQAISQFANAPLADVERGPERSPRPQLWVIRYEIDSVSRSIARRVAFVGGNVPPFSSARCSAPRNS